jgi:hypothetical protein
MLTTLQVLELAENGQAQRLPKREGGLLDATTAHAILTVYHALSPTNQGKLLAMPFPKMADVAWKVLESHKPAAP